MKVIKKQSGNIALIVLLASSLVVLFAALGIQISSMRMLDIYTTRNASRQTFFLAESCIEEILFQLHLKFDYSTDYLVLPSGTCAVDIQTDASDRQITVSASGDENVTRTVRVMVTISDGKIKWNSWEAI